MERGVCAAGAHGWRPIGRFCDHKVAFRGADSIRDAPGIIGHTPCMRVLIIGCGYVGLPLGAVLAAEGHEVYGMRRSEEGKEAMKAAGITPILADLTQPGILPLLPGPFDWVVNLVSSSKGGAEEYRQVYLEGTRAIMDWLRASPPKKYVHASSTSVYGQTDGSPVKENSFTQPASELAKILIDAEKLVLEGWQRSNLRVVVLRVAGIYGPDRGHLFQQYLADKAKLEGDGSRILNMIHVDDVVGAIIAALQAGRPGEIYNVVDDEPVSQLQFFRWLSEALGKSMPPDGAVPDPAARKRGLTSKRVQNRKLVMELGCRLKHPTFRQGYTAEMIRLEKLGLIEPSDD
jgi:nucleoside-diphosphate-sugar epimerase